MTGHIPPSIRKSLMLFAGVLAFWWMVSPDTTLAAGFKPPEECEAYSGDAHLNCLYAYIEIQKEKTGKIEEELKAQKEKLDKLDAKLDRQEEARTAPAPSTTVIPAPVYPNYYPGYAYPPGFFYGGSGLSLYFGSPGFYYGRPFYGPRFYGPRYFGPRYGYRGFRRW